MKRSDFIKAVSASIFFGAGAEAMGAARGNFGADVPKNSSKGAKMDGKKMLVVYYSWSGNTRCVADFIAKLTGADVLEVVPEKAYPTSYSQTVDIAKKEVYAQYKPAIKTKISNLNDYGVVFVGSPNWWGTISSPIRTFLSENDFSGISIAPFMTHEGSAMGRAVGDIGKICRDSKVLAALPIRGGSVKKSEKTVENWLRQQGAI